MSPQWPMTTLAEVDALLVEDPLLLQARGTCRRAVWVVIGDAGGPVGLGARPQDPLDAGGQAGRRRWRT